MPTAQRRATPSVIARLLAAPQDFEFVQAVHLLAGWLAEQGADPRQALRICLRFENSLHLGFPAAEIEALRLEPAEGDQAGADGQGGEPGWPRLRLTPSFMGLLGVHGALPAHVTERIATWQAERGDAAPRAFLDMLSGRMVALYYEAWSKYRVERADDGRADRLRPMLLALAGCAPGSVRQAGVPEDLVAHFAGLLQGRPVGGVALERLLAGYFGIGIALQEAVGHWSRLLPAEQTALGVNASLGQNTALGARSWRPDLRARLRIGPLGRDAFERFLPSGEAAAMLRAILRLLAPPTIDFEIQLVLCAADINPARLGAAGAAGPARLGRDAFLLGEMGTADRADVRYLVTPMAPLRPLPALPRKRPAAQ